MNINLPPIKHPATEGTPSPLRVNLPPITASVNTYATHDVSVKSYGHAPLGNQSPKWLQLNCFLFNARGFKSKLNTLDYCIYNMSKLPSTIINY